MKLYRLFIFVILVGCDAVQQKSGVILNSETRLPLEGVVISKYGKEDSTNNFTNKIYSDEKGQFEFRSVGMTNSFELFIMKERFKIRKLKMMIQTRFYSNQLSNNNALRFGSL